ncbi:unnamed protein product [Diplocarpon coronariae]|nr:hypothetical protein JHW43_003704 [Diplocarpon mali]
MKSIPIPRIVREVRIALPRDPDDPEAEDKGGVVKLPKRVSFLAKKKRSKLDIHATSASRPHQLKPSRPSADEEDPGTELKNKDTKGLETNPGHEPESDSSSNGSCPTKADRPNDVLIYNVFREIF